VKNYRLRWSIDPEKSQDGPAGLFHYSGTAFYQVDSKAIGQGLFLANGLISEYCSGVQSLEELASLAVFITKKVKGRIDTCGGFTSLAILRKGGDLALADSRTIEALEDQQLEMESASQQTLKQRITSKPLEVRWMLRQGKEEPEWG